MGDRAKYRLYISNQLRYYFVTTKLTQEESVEEMKKISSSIIYSKTTSYKITKVENGKDTVIYKGNIKATN
jgi:hypothetical protein